MTTKNLLNRFGGKNLYFIKLYYKKCQNITAVMCHVGRDCIELNLNEKFYTFNLRFEIGSV